MKRILFLIIGCWLSTMLTTAQTNRDWENPAVLGINKLP